MTAALIFLISFVVAAAILWAPADEDACREQEYRR